MELEAWIHEAATRWAFSTFSIRAVPELLNYNPKLWWDDFYYNCCPDNADTVTDKVNKFVLYQRKLHIYKNPGPESMRTWLAFWPLSSRSKAILEAVLEVKEEQDEGLMPPCGALSPLNPPRGRNPP